MISSICLWFLCKWSTSL